MAKDRTAVPFEPVKHAHRHGHPQPVPHLNADDDHGPEVEHFHVHTRGGPHDPYDHHDPTAAAFDHLGDDIPNPDLKQPPGVADNNNS